MKNNKKGFSIIELLVGIFIFAVGLTSVYILIISTGNMTVYSKNSIIASNLAREGVEIVKNVRDNNYIRLYNWNKLPGSDYTNLFSTGTYYTVENNFDNDELLADINEISDFGEGSSELMGKMLNYRLYLTTDGYYTYDNSSLNTPTNFYRYIKFDEVTNTDNLVFYTGALLLTSTVAWYDKGYHDVSIDTIITDWQR